MRSIAKKLTEFRHSGFTGAVLLSIAAAGYWLHFFPAPQRSTAHDAASQRPASQSIIGDCRSQNTTARYGSDIHCEGDFKFQGTSPDGTTLTADVSGRHNQIKLESVGTAATTSPAGTSSNISISQSGTGSSVRITFAAAPDEDDKPDTCLLYTSPSPRDQRGTRMPSSA